MGLGVYMKKRLILIDFDMISDISNAVYQALNILWDNKYEFTIEDVKENLKYDFYTLMKNIRKKYKYSIKKLNAEKLEEEIIKYIRLNRDDFRIRWYSIGWDNDFDIVRVILSRRNLKIAYLTGILDKIELYSNDEEANDVINKLMDEYNLFPEEVLLVSNKDYGTNLFRLEFDKNKTGENIINSFDELKNYGVTIKPSFL